MSLRIKNAHSILATLQQRPADVLEIRPPTKGGTPAWDEVIELANELNIPQRTGKRAVPQGRRGAKRGHDTEKTGREGAGEAMIRELPDVTLQELFADAQQRAGGHGLWLALDCLQDPHNVGAILRTAAFFGIQGVLMTVDRSAPLSATVYDVSAGGAEYIPISIQTNLARSFEIAKEAGVWVLGSSEHADTPLDQVQRDRPWLLVIGNEAHGIRRLTTENCDTICQIPRRGPLDSLNASVAAGILMAALTS